MARILLVDDTPDLLALSAQRLELLGHDVETAPDGCAAVDAFTRSLDDRARFDLVILDLAMPRLNGFDAADAILKLWPTQKVVFLTNYDEPLSVGRAATSGALGVWKKSIDLAELRTELLKVL